MATDREALLLQLSADVRGLQKSWDRAGGIVDEGAKRMERRGNLLVNNLERQLGGIKLPRSLAREYEQLGKDIGAGLMGASRTAQIALAGVSAYAIKLSMDAGEIESAFDVAFKGASTSAREFSNVLADKVGRDAVELRESMTRLQLVLTGTGVAAGQAATMVQRLTETGVDAGSLFNTSDAEALQKIISGLTGESEPLKAFGVVITEAAVKAELLRLGFKGNAEQASEAAKSIARANLIIAGLAVAQGDATRTADSAANKARAMRAEFNKAARELGEQLLPAFVQVTGGATDLLKAFNEMPDGVQVAGLAILGFIAAGGPIGGLLANLVRVIKLAKETRGAIAAIGAANAAAGAGTGAGAAAAAAGGAAGLGLVAGVPIAGTALGGAALIASGAKYQKTVRAVQDATDEALQAAINSARREIEASDGGPAGKQRLAKMQGDLSKLMFEQLRRRAVADLGGSDGGAATPGEVLGGFTLAPGQQTPAGPGKPKKGPQDVTDQRSAQVSAQVTAAEVDVLRARMDLATSAKARAVLEFQIVEKSRKIEDDRLTAQIAALKVQQNVEPAERERLQAELSALRLKNEEVAGLQRQAITRETADQLAQERLELALMEIDGQGELAALQSSMARTASERRVLELRLLDLADQRVRAEAEALIASRSETDQARGRSMLGQLSATRGLRQALVMDQTAGPAEAFVRANAGAEQLAETLQGDFVQGIDALSRGFGEAAAGARSLGDVAKNVFRQLVADFVAAQAKKAAASFLGNVMKIPGFATGTNSAPGGLSVVGERGPELVNLPKGAQVIPNNVLRALANVTMAPARGAASPVRLSISLEGANGDETIRRIAYQAALEGAAAARAAAVGDVRQQQARSMKARLF